MAEFQLTTERLVLRNWRGGDWESFFGHTNTPSVMRWLGEVLDEDARLSLRERIEACKERHGHSFWAVERKVDGAHLSGQLLGFCGLKRVDEEGGPIGDFEIGWRLREDAWGHGYAREAAEASLRAGFEQFGAPHIIALTVEGNTASWRLMERLGMHRRRDLDFHSAEVDPGWGAVIAYSITRQEWEQTL